MRGLALKGEGGSITLVFALVIIVLLVTLHVSMSTETMTETAGDMDVLRDLEKAARAGAAQVTEDSMADGDPRVNADAAHVTFRRFLAANLGLDETTLSPLPGSLVSNLDYTFVVYNMNGDYESGGAPAGKKYTFTGGVLNTQNYTPAGYPYLFGVDSGSVVPGVSGPINCTMDRPGVVVSLRATVNRTMGRDTINVSRWVAAKVVKIN